VIAVDCDHASGHERASLRNQQEERAVELAELSQPALRHALDQRLPVRALKEIVVELGGEITGASALTRMP